MAQSQIKYSLWTKSFQNLFLKLKKLAKLKENWN